MNWFFFHPFNPFLPWSNWITWNGHISIILSFDHQFLIRLAIVQSEWLDIAGDIQHIFKIDEESDSLFSLEKILQWLSMNKSNF
jgi:hypothetical protein